MPESKQILISAHPFAQSDTCDEPDQGQASPLTLLRAAGLTIRRHDLGRRPSAAELAPLLKGVTGLIAGTEPLAAELLANSPDLRVISRVGVGLDSIDLACCEALGITVLTTPDAATEAVAEYTFGLMIALTRGIVTSHEALRQGRWQRSFGLELSGARLGLLGCGRIGRAVARRAAAFGLRVSAHDPHQPAQDLVDLGIRPISTVSKLLAGSDIVSLHLPLTPATRGLIDTAALADMPAGSYLVNTARGGLVDEAALLQALQSGQLAGAALDVYDHEPYTGPLSQSDKVILTAHMAANSAAARLRMETHAARNLVAFFKSPYSGSDPESAD